MTKRQIKIVSGDDLFRIFKSSDAQSILVVKHVRNSCIGQTVSKFPATGRDRYSLKVVTEIVKSWANA